MLELLTRDEILSLYEGLRADYFEVTIELLESEQALRQAYAMVELGQLHRQEIAQCQNSSCPKNN